jgi:hypothetical protein
LALLIESQFFCRVAETFKPYFTSAEPAKPGTQKREKAMLRNFKVILAVLVVLILAGGAYAFANSNTVADPGNAGYLSSQVSGFTITNVVYHENVGDLTKIDKIEFKIAPSNGGTDAVTVKIRTAAAGAWTTCVVSGVDSPKTATCTFMSGEDPAPILVESVTKLDILASTNPLPN